MPKVIQSPVKHFPGTVTLSEPLTLPQVVKIDECLLARKQYFEEVEVDGKHEYRLKDGSFWSNANTVEVGAIVECVDEWDLKNFPDAVTPDTFPGSPRAASVQLINWLVIEVLKVYRGEVEVPNE